MTEISQLIGISRVKLYHILSGIIDDCQSYYKRLTEINSMVEVIKKYNIKNLNKYIHRRTKNNPSLFNVIKKNKIDQLNKVMESLQLLVDKETETRLKSKGFGENLRTLSDVVSEYSVVVNED